MKNILIIQLIIQFYFFKKEKYFSPNGQTFNDFLNGNLTFLNEEKPTLQDFENHLGTIFTEIRLKQVIEFRSLDTCNFGCICNGPSFYWINLWIFR